MSRIGQQVIEIPQGTEVTVDGNLVTAKGPKGELSRKVSDVVSITIEDGKISFSLKKDDQQSRMLWGTTASHVKNMVDGVSKGFEKKLIIEGVGFKANMQGNDLVLNVGFSHPVQLATPEGLTVTAEKEVITVSGFDKELVGFFASKIRSVKKPEPYKGKGIRYDGEIIRRKQGKKAVA